MLRHGIARDVVTALAAMSRAYRGWGGSAPVTPVSHDGGELAFAGRTFEVLHRPGHSPGDTIFFDARPGELLAGDHLIKHISSNPLISLPLGGRSASPARPPARAADVPGVPAGHAGDAGRARPARPRRRVRRPRAADRRALRHARAPRAQVAGADRRAAALGARHRARRSGATSPSPRPTSRSARCSATSTCCSSAARSSRRSTTASSTSRRRRWTKSRSSSSRCWSRSSCCRPPRGRSTCPTRSCSWSAGRCSACCRGLPEVELNPDLVLVIFLPPLLYSAAFFANLRDLRADLRPITLLSIGLVLATCSWSRSVAHALIDALWPAAFVLGAIVGPTDPVAATAIARRLGVPAAARLDPRGRGAGQRRHRARGLQDRDRRRPAPSPSRCWTPAGSSSGRRRAGSRSGSPSAG